ncbi:sigma-70 family RNA polymerase sigma factor [Falsibacillus pallidus]|uniref:sigma-70 family RNA polymerase sigma factor n=1 Tax=Falsibacillus pallidus TaxID=493781 RepID=UPI003D96C4AD
MNEGLQQNGDLNGYVTQLLEDYGEEIKRMLYSYVKDWQLTEDLTQEVFITAFLKMDTFEGKSNVKTWLYKIAINKAKDYLRSWSYRKSVITNQFSQQSSKNNTAEAEILLRENEKEIISEVFKLPIKYREIILLYYYKEFSINEISTITNLNSSTVRTRLSRGRKLLEQKLGGFLNG